MFEIEYLTDKQGQPKAVIIPIELWRKILPNDDVSLEELAESIEDYCLNKAMDEADDTPLLNREDALAYLEES
jgi:RelB Antitoxin alpha helical domain